MTWSVSFVDNKTRSKGTLKGSFSEKPTSNDIYDLGLERRVADELAKNGRFYFAHVGYWVLEETIEKETITEKPVGYHLTTIEKSEYGTVGKVSEELLELIDAIGQDCKIMMLVELSDLVGAIEALVPQINVKEIEPLNVVVTLEDIIRTVGLIAQQPHKLEDNCVRAIRMIYRYVYHQSNGFIERKDLNKMSDITKRAFKNGERK